MECSGWPERMCMCMLVRILLAQIPQDERIKSKRKPLEHAQKCNFEHQLHARHESSSTFQANQPSRLQLHQQLKRSPIVQNVVPLVELVSTNAPIINDPTPAAEAIICSANVGARGFVLPPASTLAAMATVPCEATVAALPHSLCPDATSIARIADGSHGALEDTVKPDPIEAQPSSTRQA